jgi:hypothetical protein
LTPWLPSTHATTLHDGQPVKVVPIDEYERARLCVNACHGVADERLLMVRPGDLKALLAKKKPPEKALFDRGEDAPASAHKQAVHMFCSGWEELYRAKYSFNAGKDAAHVKWIIGHLNQDLEELARVLRRFFRDGDEFIVKNRHSVGVLRSQLHRWLADPVEATAAAPKSKIAESMEKLRLKLKEQGGSNG